MQGRVAERREEEEISWGREGKVGPPKEDAVLRSIREEVASKLADAEGEEEDEPEVWRGGFERWGEQESENCAHPFTVWGKMRNRRRRTEAIRAVHTAVRQAAPQRAALPRSAAIQ